MANESGRIPDAAWFKSSYSGGNETECVEAALLPGFTAVRDSKDTVGPLLVFAPQAWADFVVAVRS
ncbi:DUF397 domain-containing protein [Streptomyces sp. NBC_00878]|uniref:DUF397 domain-containing protein n=1 Tax=Streptomyces sp. NBC_00878 TaxID=2975854 RepID=UPI00225B75B7|nr:DUF397 domain-containing protein [Streptomyces sp. NBC_00878]MCX4908392.1 DUF397 domain-containing protein [Streptomyces sp. NBC_00878]